MGNIIPERINEPLEIPNIEIIPKAPISPLEIKDLSTTISSLLSEENLSNTIASVLTNLQPLLIQSLETSTKSVFDSILMPPLQEYTMKSCLPLTNIISTGFEQLNIMQLELNQLLQNTSKNLGLQIPVIEEEPLLELIKQKNKAKILQKLETLDLQNTMNEEYPEDIYFDFGYILIQIISGGYSKGKI